MIPFSGVLFKIDRDKVETEILAILPFFILLSLIFFSAVLLFSNLMQSSWVDLFEIRQMGLSQYDSF
jgi:sorbitol-specific phosphotransferase system component IIBC